MFVEPTYNGVVRDRPPFPERLFGHGEWWGAREWLVKAEMCAPTYAADMVETARIGDIVRAVAAGGPGVEADLGVGRFSPKAPHHVLIPIGADPRHAVDPEFLHYASAAAGVSEWCWISEVTFTGDSPGGILAGRQNGTLVAIVAPVWIGTEDWH